MSASGLSRAQRLLCRDRVVAAAMLALAHKAEVHYTQGSQRWDGIKNDRRARRGQFPRQADCSSFATWCLWNGLFLSYHLDDIVNGHNWTAGYTGTMLDHGKRVGNPADELLRGDCVFYTGHVAIVVGRKNGVPMVVSHGQESGPKYLQWHYRSDFTQARRLI
jgi:cell wall-associated NlpC family hydrolase